MPAITLADRFLKNKELRREMAHFLVWGFINTAFMYTMFAIFQLLLSYAVAYTIAYGLGIAFSYYVNSRFVFHGKMTVKKAASYPIVYVTQYVIGLLTLAIFIDGMGLSTILSLPLSTTVSIPVTFIMSRAIIK